MLATSQPPICPAQMAQFRIITNKMENILANKYYCTNFAHDKSCKID